MAEKIEIQTDLIHKTAQNLYSTAIELESLIACVPRIDHLRLQKLNNELLECKLRAKGLVNYMQKISKGTHKAADMFSVCEDQLAMYKSRGTGVRICPRVSVKLNNSASEDEAFMRTISKVIGGFGVVGGIVGSTIKWGLDPSAKNLSLLVIKSGKAIVKWTGFKKNTRYDLRYKKMLGLDKYLKNPSKATKWSKKFKNNFNKSFRKGLWEKGKTASNLFTWGAAAISAMYDNANEYLDGKISLDRAVVEGVVETVGTVVVASAASALVVAISPIALPGVAVAVIGAGVVWGADYISKQICGMGVVEGVGHLAGEIYNFGKKTSQILAEKTKSIVAGAKNTVAKWFNPLTVSFGF